MSGNGVMIGGIMLIQMIVISKFVMTKGQLLIQQDLQQVLYVSDVEAVGVMMLMAAV